MTQRRHGAFPGAGHPRLRQRRLLAVAALAGIAVLSAAGASAQSRSQVEGRLTPEFRQCMSSGDAAGGVTSAMQDCTGAENGRQDRRLNAAYRAALARLSPAQGGALRVSERAWIAERQARCDHAAAEEAGGRLAAVIYSRCMLDETVRRTVWLERYRP